MKTPKPRKLASFSEYQAEFSLAHELPYWEFLPDCVVLSDGSLVTGLTLKGIPIDTWDTDRINQLSNDVRSALNSVPDGIELSFHQEITSDLNALLDEHLSLKGKSPLIEWVSQARGAALKRDRERELLLRSELYLFISKRFSPQNGKGTSFFRGFFSKPASFQKVSREEHDKSLKELLQVSSGIQASLESLGVSGEKIGPEDVLKLIYRFINPGRHQTILVAKMSEAHRNQEFSPQEIMKVPALALPSPREQLAFSDVIQGYDSFYLDGYYHRVISLKSLPEFTHAAMISRLSQLAFPYSLNVHIKVPEQSKELSQLQAKRRMAHSMSMSHGGRATDLESEAKLQSAEELLREIINTGQKIFYFQATVLIRAKSQDEIESKCRTILTKLRELNGCEGMNETVAAFKTWKTLLPFGNTMMVRPKRIKTDNLADFVPIYAPYDGKTHESAKPVCLFRNRALGLTQYDPFDSRLPNYNALVTGSSGSGKSFLNNLVLFQYLTQDPLVFIIDIGGSYKKLCEFLNGQYIEIAPARENESVPCINPMALAPGMTEPSPQKIKFLLSLLENLLTDEDGDKLPKLDKSLLEEAALETYRKHSREGQGPRLSDLSSLLSKSEHTMLRNFAKMLYPWTGDRPYGKLLDAPSSLDLTQDFVVFDLKGLSSYPDLQAAMILIITDFILGRERVYIQLKFEA